jgi:hypothetical protein
VSSQADAAQRSTMPASRQRVTLWFSFARRFEDSRLRS